MAGNAIFQKWRFSADANQSSVVFPDGCRDVIIVEQDGGIRDVFLTELDFRPRNVEVARGTTMTGFRLRPGLAPDPDAIGAIFSTPEKAASIIRDALVHCDDLDGSIDLLASGVSLKTAARAAGVSERTLQRRFAEYRLPNPDFWRLLGRARRAVALLGQDIPLAEIAGIAGYADQAHMSRAFMRWFGVTPARLRGQQHIVSLLAQPALSNWTGEQISTR